MLEPPPKWSGCLRQTRTLLSIEIDVKQTRTHIFSKLTAQTWPLLSVGLIVEILMGLLGAAVGSPIIAQTDAFLLVCTFHSFLSFFNRHVRQRDHQRHQRPKFNDWRRLERLPHSSAFVWPEIQFPSFFGLKFFLQNLNWLDWCSLLINCKRHFFALGNIFYGLIFEKGENGSTLFKAFGIFSLVHSDLQLSRLPHRSFSTSRHFLFPFRIGCPSTATTTISHASSPQ